MCSFAVGRYTGHWDRVGPTLWTLGSAMAPIAQGRVASPFSMRHVRAEIGQWRLRCGSPAKYEHPLWVLQFPLAVSPPRQLGGNWALRDYLGTCEISSCSGCIFLGGNTG